MRSCWSINQPNETGLALWRGCILFLTRIPFLLDKCIQGGEFFKKKRNKLKYWLQFLTPLPFLVNNCIQGGKNSSKKKKSKYVQPSSYTSTKKLKLANQFFL